jgi:DIS3-like exonuclease 2
VHRLLEKALIYGPEMEKQVDSKYMIDLMESCNDKKMNAKRVSDGCEKIFMALYLKNHIKITEGIVIELNKTGSSKKIKVFVKEYEIQVTLDFNEVKNLKDIKIIPDKKNEQFIQYVVSYQLPNQ